MPLSQARSLLNIVVHVGSYKAVDWLSVLLCTGEVVLAGRVPEDFFTIFMHLCRAGRLLFKPIIVTEEDLGNIDVYLKRFCSGFYKHIYVGREERLGLCRSTVVALLDVVPCTRACGPAWNLWQFPTKRYIGCMARLIRSRRFPRAALTRALSKKFRVELIPTFAETYLPTEWDRKALQSTARNPTRRLGRPKLAESRGACAPPDF